MNRVTPDTAGRRLVLASASAVRARLLRAAGVPFDVVPAGVDEAAIRQSLRAEGVTLPETAMVLAEAKALQVSRSAPAALVLGCDQMLGCDGVGYDKPAGMAEARAHLTALAGRRHELHAALAVALDGSIVWRHAETARLTMRPLDGPFVDGYLAKAGESVLASVGAYEIEGLGAQLFTRIDGDLFAVQGLPLLPLLDFLRRHGVIAT